MQLLAFIRVEIVHFKKTEGLARNFETFVEMQTF